MSRYKQASLRRKMRKADKQMKRGVTGRHDTHWVAPSQQHNTSGQRRVQRANRARQLLAGVIVPVNKGGR